ncbi:uncharacterized protein EI90DRAFT_2990388, partial [Cantharellus anzutake]|uniref:uncharacterized protein n=1 Tax=Cantharellus anzutake TaxID=1750568 RepID=UPI001907EF04
MTFQLVDAGKLPIDPPVPLIRTDEDVSRWHRSKSYQEYLLFIQILNEAVVGQDLPDSSPSSHAVSAIIQLLDKVEQWVEDIPPLPTPQRFGNLAFRDWGRRLEERAPQLLSDTLPAELHSAIPHLVPYLLTSFGSFGRVDYGSGHELSFVLFLLGLTLLGFFRVSRVALGAANSSSGSGNDPTPGDERALVLQVFRRYLLVAWKLQDVYQLEPAGSHGVWGLDDYQFLPFYWGSAQIRGQKDVSPTIILNPTLPPTNLYNLGIDRIRQLKQGPFHEHSPQLYSIAVGVQGWRKVNTGMFKMYVAEVLSKRVVVQHVPLGGLLSWD